MILLCPPSDRLTKSWWYPLWWGRKQIELSYTINGSVQLVQALYKLVFFTLSKAKRMPTWWPSSSTPGYISIKNECLYSPKDLFKNDHSSCIHDCPKLEAIQLSLKTTWRNKLCCIHTMQLHTWMEKTTQTTCTHNTWISQTCCWILKSPRDKWSHLWSHLWIFSTAQMMVIEVRTVFTFGGMILSRR